jgi:hypothetical protein
MLWELPIETRGVDELAQVVKVLSGYQSDSVGATPAQNPEGVQNAWRILLAQHQKEVLVHQEDIINWHLREAEASEKEKQWSAAVFHWNCLVQAQPDNQTYHDRLNHARDALNTPSALPNP